MSLPLLGCHCPGNTRRDVSAPLWESCLVAFPRTAQRPAAITQIVSVLLVGAPHGALSPAYSSPRASACGRLSPTLWKSLRCSEVRGHIQRWEGWHPRGQVFIRDLLGLCRWVALPGPVGLSSCRAALSTKDPRAQLGPVHPVALRVVPSPASGSGRPA